MTNPLVMRAFGEALAMDDDFASFRDSDGMAKAAKPPPGYQPVPHSKRGGFRKRTSDGYDYWYPPKVTPGPSRSSGEGKEVSLSVEQLDRVLKEGTFSLISAGPNPRDPAEAALPPDHPIFQARHQELKRAVAAMGLNFTEVQGHYGGPEPSILVYHKESPKPPEAGDLGLLVLHRKPTEFSMIRKLARQFNQDSVIHAHKGTNECHFMTGPHAGTHIKGQGFEYLPGALDYYTEAPTDPPTRFSLNLDFDSGNYFDFDSALMKAKKKAPPPPPRRPVGQKPPGAGWELIPRGKKGGYRRRKGKDYEYWYPDASPPKFPAGAKVTVGSDPEVYIHEPDHAPTGEGRTYVRSVSSGKYIIVPISRLRLVTRTRARAGLPAPKKKTRKPSTKKPKAPPLAESTKRDRKMVRAGNNSLPAEWNLPDLPPTPEQGEELPANGTTRAAVYKGSQAKPGTMVWKMENGEYMLRRFQGKLSRRMRLTVDVPKSDTTALVNEVQNVIHSAAREIAKRWRIPVYTQAGRGELHPDYEELVAAGNIGLVMALGNYRGGRAFVPYVRDYAKAYAIQAVRQIRTGTTIPDSKMRVLTSYAAAKSRASTEAREKKGEDPTPEQIARAWYLTKRDVWTGRADSLGRYMGKRKNRETGKVEVVAVDQAYEQVPDSEQWQVRTPDGKAAGPKFPSKVELVAEMERLLQGNEVADDAWMASKNKIALPDHATAGMPAGSALYVIDEMKGILSKLGGDKGTALAMKWGVYEYPDEDRDWLAKQSKASLKTLAADRNLAIGGSKGELVDRIHQWASTTDRPGSGGRQATAEEVVEVLGLTGHKGKKLAQGSLNAKVRRLWSEGLGAFWHLADAKSSEVSNFVREWNRASEPDLPSEGRVHAAWFPSHQELRDRFKTDERVALYYTAIRAGKASKAASVLDAEVSGQASAIESADFRAEMRKQEHKEAVEKYNRYKAVTADPTQVRDMGPTTGTPGEADWLYADTVLSGFMRARIKGA